MVGVLSIGHGGKSFTTPTEILSIQQGKLLLKICCTSYRVCVALFRTDPCAATPARLEMPSRTAYHLSQFSISLLVFAAGDYGIRQLPRRRHQCNETFSRIPGHSGYYSSRYLTCLAPFARCTLTSYSSHSAQLRLRRQTDVHMSSSERCSNAMPTGKAGILTTKEPASSQSKLAVPEPGAICKEYRNPSLCIAAEQRTHHFVKADFHIARGRYLFLSSSLLSSAPQPKGCLHVRSRLVTSHV
jgi:hypothetical protein